MKIFAKTLGASKLSKNRNRISDAQKRLKDIKYEYVKHLNSGTSGPKSFIELISENPLRVDIDANKFKEIKMDEAQQAKDVSIF